jgi:segregation and condensation protein A
MPDDSAFQITLQDFSGPLDLLCHLVESNAIEASSVKLTDVLSQYVSYLVTSKKTALTEIAEFFSLASRLLIRKVRSLLPRTAEEENAGADEGTFDEGREDDYGLSEEALAAVLERFKPYRHAAMKLDEMKKQRERSFVRISDEGGPPWFDIGDLYSLSTLWWSLAEEYSRNRARDSMAGFMEDIPDAAPQEVQVDRRMDDIRSLLAETEKTRLSSLLGYFADGGLIVTLLALLELSRLGCLGMTQSEEWGDIEIEAR